MSNNNLLVDTFHLGRVFQQLQLNALRRKQGKYQGTAMVLQGSGNVSSGATRMPGGTEVRIAQEDGLPPRTFVFETDAAILETADSPEKIEEMLQALGLVAPDRLTFAQVAIIFALFNEIDEGEGGERFDRFERDIASAPEDSAVLLTCCDFQFIYAPGLGYVLRFDPDTGREGSFTIGDLEHLEALTYITSDLFEVVCRELAGEEESDLQTFWEDLFAEMDSCKREESAQLEED